MTEKPKPCHSIGIQWGFWYWSESQYAWVGGAGAGIPGGPPEQPPEAEMLDNFNDNTLDPNKWVTKKFSQITYIDIFERNQRLEIALSVDRPDVAPKAGVRTKNTFDIDAKTILAEFYVPNTNDYARNVLVVTPEDIPEDIANDPFVWLKDNSKQGYRILVNPTASVGSKTTGGVITNLGVINYTLGAWTGKMRMVRVGTTITLEVYRDGAWQSLGSESCMFVAGTALYIYLCSEDNWARSLLHGEPDAWYDNFSIA